ncbi:MAG: hypothetical protein CMJ18_25355 [Phycisphaeraceae bacterium]|nr:hypothetical protein [Phycisphaeraceae bacterium]
MIWDDHAYLMADLELIDAEDGVGMVRAEAYKHADNPVGGGRLGVKRKDIARPELLNGYPKCVVREGGVYRGWFACRLAREPVNSCLAAYGESDDGVHFRPRPVPKSARGGAAERNVVCITSDPRFTVSEECLFHDPLDEVYPYKTVVLTRGTADQLNPATRAQNPGMWESWRHHPSLGWFVCGLGRSRDGFHWEMPPAEQTLVDDCIEGPVILRALDGGYVVGNQMVGFGITRKFIGWVTYDGKRARRLDQPVFALPEHMTNVSKRFLGKTSLESFAWVQSHVRLVPWKKGPSMFALHGYLYGPPRIDRYAHTYDIGLAVSSTGYAYRQVWPFRPFLRRGNMGEWDCTGTCQTASIVETPTHTLFYYFGGESGNARTDPRYYRYGWGVGHVEKDRLGFQAIFQNVDYEKRPRRGVVTLRPLTLPDRPGIAINADNCTASRTIRLELRRKSGRVIPGFSFRNCVPVTRSGLRRNVEWKNRDVRQLAGREIVVAAELASRSCQYPDLHSPRLYALYTNRK